MRNFAVFFFIASTSSFIFAAEPQEHMILAYPHMHIKMSGWPARKEAIALFHVEDGKEALTATAEQDHLWESPHKDKLADLLFDLTKRAGKTEKEINKDANILGMFLGWAKKRDLWKFWIDRRLSSDMTVPGFLLSQAVEELNVPAVNALLDAGVCPNIANTLNLSADTLKRDPNFKVTYPLLAVVKHAETEESKNLFDLLLKRNARFWWHGPLQNYRNDAEDIPEPWKRRYKLFLEEERRGQN